MNCSAPTYMQEISKEEFVDMINTLNCLRDGWANGVMYHDAQSYASLAFHDEVNNRFYKTKTDKEFKS